MSVTEDSLPRPDATEAAMDWMLEHNLLVRKPMKDPETFATTNGYILSVGFREKIGSYLLRLFTRTTKKVAETRRITVRDAFLAATISALIELNRASIPEDDMALYANIVMAILPIAQLERIGIADRQLRSLAHDRQLVRKVQNLLN